MTEWDPIAPYYDYLFEDRTADIDFWVRLAKRFESPILELSCGTGRLTIPIAKAGVRVTGLDISKSMLKMAARKISTQSKQLRKNITLLHGDVTGFHIAQQHFTAIFSPWGFIPVTPQQQIGMLESVKKHLLPDGRLIIDIENLREPEHDWNYSKIREYKTVPKKGITLLRQAYNTGLASTRCGNIIFTLDVIRSNGTMRRFVTERATRWYTASDILTLLKRHGFEIEVVYGDYDFSPWSLRSKQAIIVARMCAVSRNWSFKKTLKKLVSWIE